MELKVNPLAEWLGEVPSHWKFYKGKPESVKLNCFER